MAQYGKITKSELNKLYSKPHYYYKVVSDDIEVFGSLDKKEAVKVFNETKGNYVELVQLNHGDFHKVVKSKEIE